MSIHCLPTEVLETIFLRIVTPKTDLKLVAQDLACVAQVSKAWHSTLRYSCWQKVLRIGLQKEVSCTASEAIWLLEYLRGEQGYSISATKAKRLFKFRESDLAQLHVFSSRFLLPDVLELAIKKYGGVSQFQEACSEVPGSIAESGQGHLPEGRRKAGGGGEGVEGFQRCGQAGHEV